MNAALVIAQFGGGWPYLDAWMSSVARQPMDILFFTDCELDPPDNIKVTRMTLDEMFDRVEGALFPYGHNKFQARFPYKLCDVKSFYGVVFEEELKGYEYWGYGDSDVLYGELPEFGEHDLYCHLHSRSDMALVRSATPVGKWFIPGHFVMMRNNDASRSILEELPTASRLLTDYTNRYIDEHLVPTILYHKFPDRGNIKSNDYEYVSHMNCELRDGKLYIGGVEHNYIHFYKDKNKIKTGGWRDIPSSFNLKDICTK